MVLAKDIRILVADDIYNMRAAVKTHLKNMGFNNIKTVEDGRKAWEVLNEEAYDLVIADWKMPNMDGLQLLERIRSSEIYTDMPFLMITALGTREDVIQAVQAGVTEYIVKPFNGETLKLKLDRILGR